MKQTYPGGMDDEGPVEVVVSRLLSAIGYHQPPSVLFAGVYSEKTTGEHTPNLAAGFVSNTTT